MLLHDEFNISSDFMKKYFRKEPELSAPLLEDVVPSLESVVPSLDSVVPSLASMYPSYGRD
jgi:hypothetical protein